MNDGNPKHSKDDKRTIILKMTAGVIFWIVERKRIKNQVEGVS